MLWTTLVNTENKNVHVMLLAYIAGCVDAYVVSCMSDAIHAIGENMGPGIQKFMPLLGPLPLVETFKLPETLGAQHTKQ